jgi:preprotein translocase subunit SecA
MRRSASEIIRNLENRIAKLERQASSNHIASDWKSKSVWLYDEGMTSQRNFIATVYVEDVIRQLRKVGQSFRRFRVIEHPMYEDMDITILELDSDDWFADDIVHSIKHRVEGTPKGRHLSKVKSMILG